MLALSTADAPLPRHLLLDKPHPAMPASQHKVEFKGPFEWNQLKPGCM